MKIPSYKNIEFNRQTITYIILVGLILYLLLRRSLLVMGLLMFHIFRWIVLLIGLYYVIYNDKTTGLLIILLLCVAIYTHSYIPSKATKEDFQNVVLEDDSDDPEYQQAVADEEKKAEEAQRKEDLIQKSAIDILPPKRNRAKAKPKRRDVGREVDLKTDRYIPADSNEKNVSDNIRKLHEKFHDSATKHIRGSH